MQKVSNYSWTHLKTMNGNIQMNIRFITIIIAQQNNFFPFNDYVKKPCLFEKIGNT